MRKGYIKGMYGRGEKKVHFQDPSSFPDKEIKWFMVGCRRLTLADKIKLLFGYHLEVGFYTIDGNCNAACGLVYDIKR